jgi:Trypsin
MKDILLIKLSSPTSIPVQTYNILPAVPSVNDVATIIGYGLTKENNQNISPILLQAQSNVASWQTCNNYYGGISEQGQICLLSSSGKDVSFVRQRTIERDGIASSPLSPLFLIDRSFRSLTVITQFWLRSPNSITLILTFVSQTCQGDSGGPVFLNNVQIGVTSFGDGCGRAGVPAVCTFLESKYYCTQQDS